MNNYEAAYPTLNTWGEIGRIYRPELYSSGYNSPPIRGTIGLLHGGTRRNNLRKVYMSKSRKSSRRQHKRVHKRSSSRKHKRSAKRSRRHMKGGSYSHGDHYDLTHAPRGAGYMPVQSQTNCGLPREHGLGASTQHGGSNALHVATASHGFHLDTPKEDIHALRGSYAPVTALSRGQHGGKKSHRKSSRKSRRKSRRLRGGYNQFMSNVPYTPSHTIDHSVSSALANPVQYKLLPPEQKDFYAHA
jgi:hypothetical protein